MTILGAFVSCNGGLAGMREDSHFFRQSGSEMIPLHLEVVAGLQIQPEPITRAEIPREPQGAIRADGSRAMHDLVDPSRRHTDIPGQPVLGQAQRLEKIRREDFARMYGTHLASGHATPSSDMLVIIDDRNLVGIAILPAKADAPLLVHTNTVLAGSITPQLLQSITRRHTKIIELLGRVHRHKFAQHRALEIRRISPDGLASEQSLGIAIGEGVDHGEQ
jgi:hypothetical protein